MLHPVVDPALEFVRCLNVSRSLRIVIHNALCRLNEGNAVLQQFPTSTALVGDGIQGELPAVRCLR